MNIKMRIFPLLLASAIFIVGCEKNSTPANNSQPQPTKGSTAQVSAVEKAAAQDADSQGQPVAIDDTSATPKTTDYDLHQPGMGPSPVLQKFARQWERDRAGEGKAFRVVIGNAKINAQPGQDNYVDAFRLALASAMLDANSNYVIETARNDIQKSQRRFEQANDGITEADAEAQCQQSNQAKLEAKLMHVANALSDKIISSLGQTNDKSTDFERAIRCRVILQVSSFSQISKQSSQLAIRGARPIKYVAEGGSVEVAVAYGTPNLELADVVRVQRAPSNINKNAANEIDVWVSNNIRNYEEILDLSGLRMFRLSNGEPAFVSVGLAGIPSGNGQMSEMAQRQRSSMSFSRADLNTMTQIQELAGASVKTSQTDEQLSEYVEALDTVIQDGKSTMRVDEQRLRSSITKEMSSISQGTLQGIVEVHRGLRESKQAGGKVAYVIRAWAPSLLAGAQQNISELGKDHQPGQKGATSGGTGGAPTTHPRSESPVLKEDW